MSLLPIRNSSPLRVVMVTSMFDHGGVVSYWKDVISHHKTSEWLIFCNEVEGVSIDPFQNARVVVKPKLIWSSIFRSSQNLLKDVEAFGAERIMLNGTLALVRILPALLLLRVKSPAIKIHCVFHNSAIYPSFKKNVVNRWMVSLCSLVAHKRIFVSRAVSRYWPVRGTVLPRPFIGLLRDVKRDETKPLKIGFLGRLSVEKDPELFLEAMGIVRQERSVDVELAGTGPLMSLRERYLWAKFCGWVSSRDWLAAVDLLVVSSQTEGWPYAVGEAIECGVPVVGVDVGGVGEVLYGVRSAWLTKDRTPHALASLVLGMISDYNNSSKRYFALLAAERNPDISPSVPSWVQQLLADDEANK